MITLLNTQDWTGEWFNWGQAIKSSFFYFFYNFVITTILHLILIIFIWDHVLVSISMHWITEGCPTCGRNSNQNLENFQIYWSFLIQLLTKGRYFWEQFWAAAKRPTGLELRIADLLPFFRALLVRSYKIEK
jgi:hypothetical protein